jgi:hypothetical protein
MPKVSPSSVDRGTECAMPFGKYVDALPSRYEGGYSPMTTNNITDRRPYIENLQVALTTNDEDPTSLILVVTWFSTRSTANSERRCIDWPSSIHGPE